jgi:hypothetical protein
MFLCPDEDALYGLSSKNACGEKVIWTWQRYYSAMIVSNAADSTSDGKEKSGRGCPRPQSFSSQRSD